MNAGGSQAGDTFLPIAIGIDHRGTEKALAESGLSTTVLRNNWHFEDLLHGLPAAIASGTWFSAAVAAIFTEFDTTTRAGGLDVVSDVVSKQRAMLASRDLVTS